MALKSDRYEFQTDISYFMPEVSRPGALVFVHSSIVGSGASMDTATNKCSHTFASGRMPLGLVLSSVVDIDTTRYHINFHKDEVDVNVSPKVRILRKGWVVTDQVLPGLTVSIGQDVFPTFSGYLTNSASQAGSNAAVGKFLTTKDDRGYAKVEINLP